MRNEGERRISEQRRKRRGREKTMTSTRGESGRGEGMERGGEREEEGGEKRTATRYGM